MNGAAARRRFAQALLQTFDDLLRRWYLSLPVLAIWALACARLFVDPAPRVPLLFNWTGSLPYRVAWLSRDGSPLVRGDLVVYRFAGDAVTLYPGLAGQPFFKVVRGLPGDVVAVEGRDVYVEREWVGLAKPRAFDGRPLAPIAPTLIPPGHFYAQGLDADSFDSRYAQAGLVRFDQVIGKAIPLL